MLSFNLPVLRFEKVNSFYILCLLPKQQQFEENKQVVGYLIVR